MRRGQRQEQPGQKAGSGAEHGGSEQAERRGGEGAVQGGQGTAGQVELAPFAGVGVIEVLVRGEGEQAGHRKSLERGRESVQVEGAFAQRVRGFLPDGVEVQLARVHGLQVGYGRILVAVVGVDVVLVGQAPAQAGQRGQQRGQDYDGQPGSRGFGHKRGGCCERHLNIQ